MHVLPYKLIQFIGIYRAIQVMAKAGIAAVRSWASIINVDKQLALKIP